MKIIVVTDMASINAIARLGVLRPSDFFIWIVFLLGSPAGE